MRLPDKPVALVRLLADRKDPHLRLGDAEDFLGEGGAHVGELEQVLGPGIRVRAGIDENGGPTRRRKGCRDSRAAHGGSRRISSRQAARSAPVFPAETTASASPRSDRAAGREHGAVPFRAGRIRRLLVHRDDLLGANDLEPAGQGCQDARAAEEDRFDPLGASLERAGDDLLGSTVAAHRVDSDADRRHLGPNRRTRYLPRAAFPEERPHVRSGQSI